MFYAFIRGWEVVFAAFFEGSGWFLKAYIEKMCLNVINKNSLIKKDVDKKIPNSEPSNWYVFWKQLWKTSE